MQSEAGSVKPGQLLEMFDSSWKVRSIWDGVKLEVVEDRSPVVLHSFTHLDPDLPLSEVDAMKCSDHSRGSDRTAQPDEFKCFTFALVVISLLSSVIQLNHISEPPPMQLSPTKCHETCRYSTSMVPV
ncbi:hypothetical protein XENOCAPTIV_009115 [Xenoophorus captivus]|uniref:Uncharacterized protein n=1 Tax=Xenoophorus captivus TaxID=1517983 RepID=A0ABV0Q9N0_9TELE